MVSDQYAVLPCTRGPSSLTPSPGPPPELGHFSRGPGSFGGGRRNQLIASGRDSGLSRCHPLDALRRGPARSPGRPQLASGLRLLPRIVGIRKTAGPISASTGFWFSWFGQAGFRGGGRRDRFPSPERFKRGHRLPLCGLPRVSGIREGHSRAASRWGIQVDEAAPSSTDQRRGGSAFKSWCATAWKCSSTTPFVRGRHLECHSFRGTGVRKMAGRVRFNSRRRSAATPSASSIFRAAEML